MFERFILEQKVSHSLCHVEIPFPQVPSWLEQLCLCKVSILFNFSVANLNPVREGTNKRIKDLGEF